MGNCPGNRLEWRTPLFQRDLLPCTANTWEVALTSFVPCWILLRSLTVDYSPHGVEPHALGTRTEVYSNIWVSRARSGQLETLALLVNSEEVARAKASGCTFSGMTGQCIRKQ